MPHRHSASIYWSPARRLMPSKRSTMPVLALYDRARSETVQLWSPLSTATGSGSFLLASHRGIGYAFRPCHLMMTTTINPGRMQVQLEKLVRALLLVN